MARTARMALDLALNGARSTIPTMAIAWQYAKIEMIPPLSGPFFHGPLGKKLEDAVGGFARNLVTGLEQKIKDIDEEEIRQIREKEAAIKAEQERQLVEAKKKEADKKAAEAAKMAAEAKKAAQKQQPKPEPKAEKKPDKPKPAPKKKPEKPKPAPKKK